MLSAACVILVACQLHGVLALTCFWCSGVDSDRLCETRPRDVISYPASINCTTKYCSSTKVIDAVTGDVRSFARLCDNIPRGNVCVKDRHLTTCFQTCTTDFCNTGNPDPSYLPTHAYSAVFLGLPDVAQNQKKSQELNNVYHIHDHVSGKSGRRQAWSSMKRALGNGKIQPATSQKVKQLTAGTQRWYSDREAEKKSGVSHVSPPTQHDQIRSDSDAEERNKLSAQRNVHLSLDSSTASSQVLQILEGLSSSSKSQVQKVSNFWWVEENVNQTKTGVTSDEQTEDFDPETSDTTLTANQETILTKSKKAQKYFTVRDNPVYSQLGVFSIADRPLESLAFSSPGSRDELKPHMKPRVTHSSSSGHKHRMDISDHTTARETDTLTRWWEKTTLQPDEDATGTTPSGIPKLLDRQLLRKTPASVSSDNEGAENSGSSGGHGRKFSQYHGDATEANQVVISGQPKRRSSVPDHVKNNINNEQRDLFPYSGNSVLKQKTKASWKLKLQDSAYLPQTQDRTHTGRDTHMADVVPETEEFRLEQQLATHAAQPFRAQIEHSRTLDRNVTSSTVVQKTENDSRVLPNGKRRPEHLYSTSTFSSTVDTWYNRHVPPAGQLAKSRRGQFVTKISASQMPLADSGKTRTGLEDDQTTNLREDTSILSEFPPSKWLLDHVTIPENQSAQKKLFHTSPTNYTETSLSFNTTTGDQRLPLSSQILDSKEMKVWQEKKLLTPFSATFNKHLPLGNFQTNLTSEIMLSLDHASVSSVLPIQAAGNISLLEANIVSKESLTEISTETAVRSIPATYIAQTGGHNSHITHSSQTGGHSIPTTQILQTDGHNISATYSSQIGGHSIPGTQSLQLGKHSILTTQSSQSDKHSIYATHGTQIRGNSIHITESSQMDAYILPVTEFKHWTNKTSLSLNVNQESTHTQTDVLSRVNSPDVNVARMDKNHQHTSLRMHTFQKEPSSTERSRPHVGRPETDLPQGNRFRTGRSELDDKNSHIWQTTAKDRQTDTSNSPGVTDLVDRSAQTEQTSKSGLDNNQTGLTITDLINSSQKHKFSGTEVKSETRMEQFSSPRINDTLAESWTGSSQPRKNILPEVGQGQENYNTKMHTHPNSEVKESIHSTQKEHIDKPYVFTASIITRQSSPVEATSSSAHVKRLNNTGAPASIAATAAKTFENVSNVVDNRRHVGTEERSRYTDIKPSMKHRSRSNTNTTKMAGKKLGGKDSKMSSQRIYLSQRVHRPGRNDMFQSEANTFRQQTNHAPGWHHVTYIHWMVLLLTACYLYVLRQHV